MDAAEGQVAAGQRHVHGTGRRARRRERGALLLEGGLDLGLECVDEGAELAPGVGRQGAERLHQPGHGAGLAAEERVGERLEGGVGRRVRQLLLELLPDRVDRRTIERGLGHKRGSGVIC
jgi:hypothetical protein